jgi:hypothetical protein
VGVLGSFLPAGWYLKIRYGSRRLSILRTCCIYLFVFVFLRTGCILISVWRLVKNFKGYGIKSPRKLSHGTLRLEVWQKLLSLHRCLLPPSSGRLVFISQTNSSRSAFSSSWWWRQEARPKHQYTPTRFHDAKSQKTAIFIVVALRTWNLTKCSWPALSYYLRIYVQLLTKPTITLRRECQITGPSF